MGVNYLGCLVGMCRTIAWIAISPITVAGVGDGLWLCARVIERNREYLQIQERRTLESSPQRIPDKIFLEIAQEEQMCPVQLPRGVGKTVGSFFDDAAVVIEMSIAGKQDV